MCETVVIDVRNDGDEGVKWWSSVNYSKKAIKNHHREVPVVVQTNIKHAQQKIKNNFFFIFLSFFYNTNSK